MSCVASSVVSTSAFLVLASSDIRLLFFSSNSRRYFSSSFLGIFATRAALVGIRGLSFSPLRPRPGGAFRTRDDTRLFRLLNALSRLLKKGVERRCERRGVGCQE